MALHSQHRNCYTVVCSGGDPLVETASAEEAAKVYLSADVSARPTVIFSRGGGAGWVASTERLHIELRKSVSVSPVDGGAFFHAYKAALHAERVNALRIDEINQEQAQELARELNKIMQALDYAAMGLRPKLDTQQRVHLLALLDAVMANRIVEFDGDDPIVKSLQRLPQPHELQALSVARSLAAHDGSDATVSFQNPQLQRAYESEQRMLSTASSFEEKIPGADLSGLDQPITIPPDLRAMLAPASQQMAQGPATIEQGMQNIAPSI